jgi:lipopolysaccharide transport protein LptA
MSSKSLALIPENPKRTASVRFRSLYCLGALVLVAVGAIAASKQAPFSRIEDFKSPEFYPAPNQTQMKSIIQGAEAEPLSGNRYRLRQLTLKTFKVTGETEMAAESPACIFDSDKHIVTSTNHVKMQTGDDRFLIEGEGFAWSQTNATFVLSNRVHTVIRRDLFAKAGRTNTTAVPEERIEIFANRFDYDRKSGYAIYRNNVRANGTNWMMRCEQLSVKIPETGQTVENITAERNVTIDWEEAHVTAGHAIYSIADDVATLTRNPSWRVDKREGRADEIVLDRTNNVFRATGNAWLKLPSSATNSIGLVGSPTPAEAPAGTNQFIEISSEHYELRTNVAVFRGGVRAAQLADTQSRAQLTCGALTVFIGGTNQVQSAVAEKDVLIEQGDNRVMGDRALFSGKDSRLELTGSPSWQMGERQGKGDSLILDQAREEMTVRGNAYMKLPRSELGGQVSETNTAVRISGRDTNQFAEIFCEQYQVRKSSASFTGGVRVEDPQMKLASASLTMEPTPDGRPGKITADGRVAIDAADPNGKKTRATGDRAVYNLTDSVLELSGKPRLESEQGTVTGDLIQWHRTNDTVVVPNYHVRGVSSGATNLFLTPITPKK